MLNPNLLSLLMFRTYSRLSVRHVWNWPVVLDPVLRAGGNLVS
jgi:hypothetical protein